MGAVTSSQSPVPYLPSCLLPLMSILSRVNRKSFTAEVPWEGSSPATFRRVSMQARCWFLWGFFHYS